MMGPKHPSNQKMVQVVHPCAQDTGNHEEHARPDKPVITIKPFAAGRLHPFVGLAFNWSTLRPRDMVAVGTMTADEAKELIDISWSLFERRASEVQLQWTRSKATVESK